WAPARGRAPAPPLRFSSAGRPCLELDVAANHAQAHGSEAAKASAVEVAHLHGLVRGARFVGGEQSAESSGNIVGIGRRSFDVAFEGDGSEMKRGAPGVLV